MLLNFLIKRTDMSDEYVENSTVTQKCHICQQHQHCQLCVNSKKLD